MTDTSVQPLGRNDPCHCGSGRKYKHCCLDKDAAATRAARAMAEAEVATPEAAAAEQPAGAQAPAKPAKPRSYQPWKRSATNTHGFQRMSTPRKVGGG
jgi:hypothetical protein